MAEVYDMEDYEYLRPESTTEAQTGYLIHLKPLLRKKAVYSDSEFQAYCELSVHGSTSMAFPDDRLNNLKSYTVQQLAGDLGLRHGLKREIVAKLINTKVNRLQQQNNQPERSAPHAY